MLLHADTYNLILLQNFKQEIQAKRVLFFNQL